MSDTPLTDDALWRVGGTGIVFPAFTRRLERQLKNANERIKRLEFAGDELELAINAGTKAAEQSAKRNWRKAKEAKP